MALDMAFGFKSLDSGAIHMMHGQTPSTGNKPNNWLTRDWGTAFGKVYGQIVNTIYTNIGLGTFGNFFDHAFFALQPR